MKALTIKQPWASLIVDGYKKYEFRGWKTKYRGKILIHAGLSLEKDMVERFEKYNLDYILGAIIGEAELVDCILVDNKFNEELRNIDPIVYGRSNHVENYAWKLENIKKYDKPIYVKGKLGLWNYGGNMEHKMKLQDGPFKAIKDGLKTIELRLYDEKRKLVKIGDTIEFTNVLNNEKINAQVTNLHLYPSFEELYKHFDKISLGYNEEDVASYKDMELYYSKEEQSKYGVVGIEIKLKK